jgi:hypothetical protein
VFENMAPKRIFGPKRNEMAGVWRKLHNEELYHGYSSPNRKVKCSRIRWAGHVARMGRRGILICFWWENQKERDH